MQTALRWVEEPLGEGMSRRWRVEEVLWEGDTQFQHVLIGRTSQGVSLFCDSDRQSTEFSQRVYHEALMLPGLLLSAKLDRVLIVGSSEGVASQIAAAAGAAHVDHVDIDRECVRVCAEHLPYGYDTTELEYAQRHDGGIHVHFTDGYEFVRSCSESETRYDLVVVDLPDEVLGGEGPQHNRLYGTEFLRLCREILSPGGVVAFQAGCATMWRNDTLVSAFRRFHEVFATTVYFGSDEHEWSFLFGTAEPVEAPVDRMVTALETLPYDSTGIDAQTLRAAAIAPKSVRDRLSEDTFRS